MLFIEDKCYCLDSLLCSALKARGGGGSELSGFYVMKTWTSTTVQDTTATTLGHTTKKWPQRQSLMHHINISKLQKFKHSSIWVEEPVCLTPNMFGWSRGGSMGKRQENIRNLPQSSGGVGDFLSLLHGGSIHYTLHSNTELAAKYTAQYPVYATNNYTKPIRCTLFYLETHHFPLNYKNHKPWQYETLTNCLYSA